MKAIAHGTGSLLVFAGGMAMFSTLVIGLAGMGRYDAVGGLGLLALVIGAAILEQA